MVKRQACFACTTPYQVMGALSITKSKKLDADIYIFGMFSDYENVAERLLAYNIFANVYAINAEAFRAPGRKGALLQMTKCREIVSSFLPKNVAYDFLYASSRAHIKNLLLHELLRRNKQLRIIVYDDGLGMYSKNSHVLNTTKVRGIAEKLFGWNLYTPERMSFMVNMPELFEKPDSLRLCEVQQMPRLPWTAENRQLLMDVFGANDEDIIKERVIVFDSLRGFDSERDKKMKELDAYFAFAVDSFGKENAIMKPHPRSKEKTTADMKLYSNTSVPMEVLYAGMGNLDEKVLITYASSAVYTPKMFFDAEPWVINLFRITDNVNGQVSEWEETYLKFKSIYREPDKVMAPENEEEFRICIKRVVANG